MLVLTPLTVALGRVARGAYWPASDIAVLQLDLTQPGVPLTGSAQNHEEPDNEVDA